MKDINFPDGAIEVVLPVLSTALYNVSNHVCMAQFDGCGNIKEFSKISYGDVLESGFYYCVIRINGVPLTDQSKAVSMIGRMQQVQIRQNDITVIIKQFLDDNTSAVFSSYHFLNHGEHDSEISISLGVACTDHTPLYFYSTPDMNKLEELYNKHYYNQLITVPPGGQRECKYIVSDEELLIKFTFDECFSAGNNSAAGYVKWLQELNDPIKAVYQSEKIRALYTSCINCAVSAYKVIPEVGFEAFFAGISYQSPARTYFRDGYSTILCLLSIKPEWVKNQILTLLRGVNPDGSCPSAVIASSDVKPFWDGHYDSPAFMIIMVYDYIAETSDFMILDQDINGCALMTVLENCLGWLDRQTDTTGLIVKPGRCRLDWADNVYREGYVTYIQALYAHATYAMAAFKRESGDLATTDTLLSKFRIIKNAINTLLWDDDKGYYINYVSNDYHEDNLSLDTVFCVLFGIADDVRSKLHLTACQKLLEVDFGVRCVYPLYKFQEHLVEKSAFPSRYHNGSDWPYLDGFYALALLKFGFDANHALTRWFDYSLEQGWFTPVEYYSPDYGKGSFLQAWSSTPAYAIQESVVEHIGMMRNNKKESNVK